MLLVGGASHARIRILRYRRLRECSCHGGDILDDLSQNVIGNGFVTLPNIDIPLPALPDSSFRRLCWGDRRKLRMTRQDSEEG
jgi:hypothetical protein